jgi:hypothetical protein
MRRGGDIRVVALYAAENVGFRVGRGYPATSIPRRSRFRQKEGAVIAKQGRSESQATMRRRALRCLTVPRQTTTLEFDSSECQGEMLETAIRCS